MQVVGDVHHGNNHNGVLGPVARPLIAPIARPSTSVASTATNASTNTGAGVGVGGGGGESSSGSTSPVRRSPSPKGVLGSSALVDEDDEVVSAGNGRRGAAPIGIGIGGGGAGVGGGGSWGPGSPRTATGGGGGAPWGPPPAHPPGFGSPRPIGPPPPVGALNTQHLPQVPMGHGSMWSAGGGQQPEWHGGVGGFFPPGGYVNHVTSPNPGA